MRILVIYDTVHGNTEQVANAIAEGLAGAGEVQTKLIADTTADDIAAADLLVAGCPTHAWNISQATKDLLRRLGELRVEGTPAATFDTKFQKWYAGSAAPKLSRALGRLGFRIVHDSESFFVAGMQGPLKDGQRERAASLGAEIASHAAEARGAS